MNSGPKFPLKTRQFAVIIEGDHTDFVITSYSDRIFIIVTQINKLGTLTLSNKETTVEGTTIFASKTLLGRREDYPSSILSRQLIEDISKTTEKSLILAVTLKKKNDDTKTLKIILDILTQNKVW